MKDEDKGVSGEKLRLDALAALRDARRQIEKSNPELLAAMRKRLEEAGRTTPQLSGEEKIDRKKNLETILKFASMKPGSAALRQSLEKFLLRRN